MYPRNASSPERISIGAVVQISDGAVQTSGVTVRVLPFGGSESDGGGTTAYSTDGVVVYTPTQAETNYTSFVLIAKKTGCIPASVTVVTSASAVAGHAGTDQSKITNNTATVNLSGTTIKTATDVETDTQDIRSRLPAALVDGRIAANAQVVGDKTGYTATVSDKTGFSLAPTTGLGNQTADITGNLSGSVGSVTGAVGSVTSFGTLVNDIATAVWGAATRTLTAFGFNVNLTPNTGLGAQDGSVGTVSTVLELGQSALSANGADAEVTAAVWDARYNQHTTAGSFGKLMDILRKANTVVEGTVTSAVTPTATSFSSNVNYPTGAFKHAVLVFIDSTAIDEQNSPILGYVNTNGVFTVEEPFTVAPTVGDEFIVIPTTHVHSVAAIADGVWDEPTSGHTTAGTTGKALIDSGAAGNPWTTDLSTGYSGTEAGNILNQVKINTETGSSPTINVYPVSASTPERVAGTTLTFYRDESRSVSVVTDFTLTNLTLQFTVEDQDGADVYTLNNASINRSAQTFTVAITTAVTGGLGQYRWSMRDISGGGSSVVAMGVLTVQEAASNV
jgi:hypothetical protein